MANRVNSIPYSLFAIRYSLFATKLVPFQDTARESHRSPDLPSQYHEQMPVQRPAVWSRFQKLLSQ